MSTLEKRIALLETVIPKKDQVRTIILVAGGSESELRCLGDGTGRKWEREPNETEDELYQRASREAMRNSAGIAILTQYVDGAE